MSKEKLHSEEKPEVYAIHRTADQWQLDRRSFLALSSSVAAAALAAGCNPQKPLPAPSSTPEPASTLTPTPSIVPTLNPAEWEEACFAVAAHSQNISAMIIDSVHSLLISSGSDSTLKMWSLMDLQLRKILSDNASSSFMAISPDSSILAAALFNKIDLWSLPDGNLLATLEGHTSQITCLAFTPDGSKLLSTQYDTTIRVWSIPDGESLDDIHTEEKVKNIAFSPDGSYLISNKENILYLRSFPDCRLIRKVVSDHMTIHKILIHPDTSRIVTTDMNGIVIWTFPNLEPIQQIELGNAIAIPKSGEYLVVLEEPQIKFWSFEQGQTVDTLSHSEPCVAVHPEGSLIALGSAIGKISLWTYPEKKLLGCPMDLMDTNREIGGLVYEINNAAGETIKYTYPCGAIVPDGAVCTCNCVSGKSQNNHSSHYWYPN